jgi:hypothetical protein
MAGKFNSDLDFYRNLSEPVFEAERKQSAIAVEKKNEMAKEMEKAEDLYKVTSHEPNQIFTIPNVHKANADNIGGTILKAIDRLSTQDELKKAQEGFKEQEIMKSAYKNAEDLSGLLA